MSAEGTIKIDTALDASGLKDGLSSISSIATKTLEALNVSMREVAESVIKLGSGFESAMSQVAATMGTTVDQIDKLSDLAKKMGSETKFSAAEAAEAINNMAMAGYSAEEIYSALPDVLNLASAGALDLDCAAQLAANGLNVMGMEVSELGEMSDKLAVTASNAYGSVADFGAGLLIAGGQASLANMNLTETFTALGILGDAGISAGEGGTALVNVLKNLYIPTSQSASAMEALGLETSNADGTFRDIQSVLQNLSGIMDGLTGEERIQAMASIFDTGSISAANALLKDSGDRWNELATAIDGSAGAARQMAEVRLDNLEGDITIMKSALEGLAISLYEAFSDDIRSDVQMVTNVISHLTTVVQENEDVIHALAGVIVAAAVAVITFKTAMAIASVVQTTAAAIQTACAVVDLYAAGANAATVASMAMSTVTKVMGTVMAIAAGETTIAKVAMDLFNASTKANVIGLVVAVIAALVAGLIALVKWQNKATETSKALSKAAENLEKSYNDVSKAVKESSEAFLASEQSIKANMTTVGNLTATLDRLKSAEDTSATGIAAMQLAVNSLNEALPGLNLEIDETGTGLNLTTEEILNFAAASDALARNNALQTYYNDIVTQIGELQVQQAEAQFRLAELQANSTELVAEGMKSSEVSALMREYGQIIQDVEAELADLGISLEFVTGEQAGFNQEIEKAEPVLDNTSSAVAELAEKYGMTAEEVESASSQMGVSVEEWAKFQEEAADRIASVYDDITSSTKKYIEDTQISYNDLVANIEANNAAWQTYNENMAYLTEQGMTEIAEYYQRMGPDLNAAISSAIEGGDFDSLQTALEEAAKTSVETAATEMGCLPSEVEDIVTSAQAVVEDSLADWEETGEFISKGLATGIIRGKDLVVSATTAVAKEGILAAKKVLEEHSPSRVFRDEIGANIAAGWAIGISGNSSLVTKAIEMTGDNVIGAAKSYLSDYKKIYATTAQEEMAYWNQIASKYETYTAQRAEADDKLFDATKDYIEERTKLEELSAYEVMEFWEIASKSYAEGSAARAEADKQLYNARLDYEKEVAERQNEYAEAYTKLMDDISDIEKNYQGQLQNRAEQIAGFTGLFSNVDREAADADALTESLRSQVQAIEDYNNAIAALAERGLDEGLLSQLQGLGPDSVDEIQTIAAMTEEQLTEYQELWQEKYALAREQAVIELQELREESDEEISELKQGFINEFGDLPETMTEIGTDVSAGLAQGILAGKSAVIDAAVSVVQAAIWAAKDVAGIASPSKVFRDEVGLNMGYGIGEGIDNSYISIAATLKARISDLIGVGNAALQGATPLSVDVGNANNNLMAQTADRMEKIEKLQIGVELVPVGGTRSFFNNLSAELQYYNYLEGTT